MNRLLLIPARGNSKGLPGKNIALLGGRPLIAWTIEQAISSKMGRVVVSTDSPEIAAIAKREGVEVPFVRPAKLATDEAGSFGVAEHALQWAGDNFGDVPEILVLLQPTSPFRAAGDIVSGVKLLETSGAPAVVGVCRAVTHPWMTRRLDSQGCLVSFCEVPADVKRRQDFSEAYEVNGAFYAIRSQVLLEQKIFEPRGTVAYMMPEERSIDIDTTDDLARAERELARR